MAFRLSEYVTSGFVINKGEYSTWGRLALRGYPHVVSFELTGYPAADLMGKHTEFDVPENDREPRPEDFAALASLKDRHVGPTGGMSAERRLGAGGPDAEPCLYLEWYSQNGHVVIELPLSKVRFLTEAEIAERQRLADEEMEEMIRESKAQRDTMDDDAPEDYLSDDDDGEGFNLLPNDFEEDMERKAQALDREAVPLDAEASEAVRELELLDDLIDGKRAETPVRGFLDGLEIPPPSSIKSDVEAEQYLKPLLARLAFFGTTMDVCEHCTPKNAYRILRRPAPAQPRRLRATHREWLRASHLRLRGVRGVYGKNCGVERKRAALLSGASLRRATTLASHPGGEAGAPPPPHAPGRRESVRG